MPPATCGPRHWLLHSNSSAWGLPPLCCYDSGGQQTHSVLVEGARSWTLPTAVPASETGDSCPIRWYNLLCYASAMCSAAQWAQPPTLKDTMCTYDGRSEAYSDALFRSSSSNNPSCSGHGRRLTELMRTHLPCSPHASFACPFCATAAAACACLGSRPSADARSQSTQRAGSSMGRLHLATRCNTTAYLTQGARVVSACTTHLHASATCQPHMQQRTLVIYMLVCMPVHALRDAAVHMRPGHFVM